MNPESEPPTPDSEPPVPESSQTSGSEAPGSEKDSSVLAETTNTSDSSEGSGVLADDSPPPPKSVLDYLVYTVSIPERTVRGASAVVAGTIRESAELLVPKAFRTSKSYNVFVQQMLDFMANDVGGVEQDEEKESSVPQVEGYVARKTVGGFMDMAGLATLHLSPMTLLAVLTDVAYGSQEYLRELALELQREGVISEGSSVENLTQLLSEVGHASGTTADALDMPPLSREALEETIAQTREALQGIDVRRVYPKAELDRMWNEIREIAARENTTMLSASSALSMFALNRVTTVGRGALSTVRVAGNMFDQHILDHYKQGLTDINEQGYYQFLSDASRPYIDAVWMNFASERETITEDVVRGRFFSRWWSKMKSWLRRDG